MQEIMSFEVQGTPWQLRVFYTLKRGGFDVNSYGIYSKAENTLIDPRDLRRLVLNWANPPFQPDWLVYAIEKTGLVIQIYWDVKNNTIENVRSITLDRRGVIVSDAHIRAIVEKMVAQVEDPEFVDIPCTGGLQMQTTPVTQQQWFDVVGSTPSHFEGGNNPVESVSWDDVQEFIQKLNESQNKYIYALPTEKQWEHACRAGSDSKYCFGDDENMLAQYAWYSKNSDRQTHPVGQLKKNALGLYDMHGNVWEWCQDLWGPGRVFRARVFRGGAWGADADNCRSAERGGLRQGFRNSFVGFRLSRSLC